MWWKVGNFKLALTVYHNKLIAYCDFGKSQNFSAENSISQGRTAADFCLKWAGK